MSPLSYEVTGDEKAQPVLLLHGFMGSKEDWREVSETLLDYGFRCVAVDLPGHGGSVGLPYPGSYTMQGTAEALLALLDELDIRRAAVVGYSMGGRLALYFALRYPGRCSGLFVESSSPGIEDEAERAARRRADEERAKLLEAGELREFIEEWYRQPLFASLARREDLLRGTVERRLENDPRELVRSLRAMGTGSQPSLWGELERLEVPALAVAGELDEKYARITRRMDEVSGVRSAVIPGAGHNVHLEAPAEYTRLLGGFLKLL